MHGIYNFDDKNVWTFVRVENDTLITGYRQTSGWARTRTVYFALILSAPLKNYGHEKYDSAVYNGFYRKFDENQNFPPEMAGRKIRLWLEPKLHNNKELLVKVGLSSVSASGALNNVMTEIPHWDFDLVVQQGREQWNNEISKIQVETLEENDKTVFYTALYHSFLSPIIYMDVDGATADWIRKSIRPEASPITRFFLFGILIGHCIHCLIWFSQNAAMIWPSLCWLILIKAYIRCCRFGRTTPTKTGA